MLVLVVNLILYRAAYTSSITWFVVGLLPVSFLIYRLLYADKVARIIVSILSVGAVYIVHSYAQIFLTDIPGDPNSLSYRSMVGLRTPSNVLPVLAPAISFLVGIVLLYTPSMNTWFSNRNWNQETHGDA